MQLGYSAIEAQNWLLPSDGCLRVEGLDLWRYRTKLGDLCAIQTGYSRAAMIGKSLRKRRNSFRIIRPDPTANRQSQLPGDAKTVRVHVFPLFLARYNVEIPPLGMGIDFQAAVIDRIAKGEKLLPGVDPTETVLQDLICSQPGMGFDDVLVRQTIGSKKSITRT